MLFSAVLVVLIVVASVAAGPVKSYSLVKSYDVSNKFADFFEFRDRSFFQKLGFPKGDPTSGFVDYVSRQEARDRGLVSYLGGKLYVGVDSNATLSTRSNGRKAIRLESRTPFDGGLMLIDIAHMPGNSCGVWPALWAYNAEEDPYSEIDILEGSGWATQSANMVSMHTCGKCQFPNLKGKEVRKDCDMNAGRRCNGKVKNPAGCGITASAPNSYGDSFNDNGGGVYALQLDDSGIKVWFHPRNNGKGIPADILAGNPNPASWPAPMAEFRSSSSCAVSKIFKNLTIIINTTFCGSAIYNWRQQTMDSKHCQNTAAGTCEAYVAANPQAYKEAYWLFNSIKTYA